MKFILMLAVAFAAACVASSSPIGSAVQVSAKSLQDDIADFFALVPQLEIIMIAFDCLEDPEFQVGLFNLFGPPFEKELTALESLPEFRELLKALDATGLPIYDYLNWLHDILDIDPFVPRRPRKSLPYGVCVGLRGFLELAMDALPSDEIAALFDEKLETSPYFKAFVDDVSSPEFSAIIQTLLNNQEFQTIYDNLLELKIPADLVGDFILALLGLNQKF